MSFVVLDTETTGRSFFQGDRLIEIGALKYERRELVAKYHTYINPECKVSLGALKVHGISDQFLLDKPLFADIAEDFVSFVRGYPLVIHNAPFDLGFLDNELNIAGLEKISGRFEVVDTLPLARKMYPGQRNSLDALCKRLGVDAKARVLHGALLDAKLLAEVYMLMTMKQHTINIACKTNKVALKSKSVANFIKKANSAELEQHAQFLANYLPGAIFDDLGGSPEC